MSGPFGQWAEQGEVFSTNSGRSDEGLRVDAPKPGRAPSLLTFLTIITRSPSLRTQPPSGDRRASGHTGFGFFLGGVGSLLVVSWRPVQAVGMPGWRALRS
jgi:hypothetical protein